MIEPVGTVLFLNGIGLTFGALWPRCATQPTEWAKFPVLILFAMAALLLLFGERNVFFWPVALFIVGVVILVSEPVRKPAAPVAPPVKDAEKEIEEKPVVKNP